MNMVYVTKPQTWEELRDKIEHTINGIPLVIIQMVYRSVGHRCWECIVTEGGHFDVCAHVRLCVYVCTCVRMDVRTHACIYIYIYIGMYIGRYVCVCVCACVFVCMCE